MRRAEQRRDAEPGAPGPGRGVSFAARVGIGPDGSLKLSSHAPSPSPHPLPLPSQGLALAWVVLAKSLQAPSLAFSWRRKNRGTQESGARVTQKEELGVGA